MARPHSAAAVTTRAVAAATRPTAAGRATSTTEVTATLAAALAAALSPLPSSPPPPFESTTRPNATTNATWSNSSSALSPSLSARGSAAVESLGASADQEEGGAVGSGLVIALCVSLPLLCCVLLCAALRLAYPSNPHLPKSLRAKPQSKSMLRLRLRSHAPRAVPRAAAPSMSDADLPSFPKSRTRRETREQRGGSGTAGGELAVVKIELPTAELSAPLASAPLASALPDDPSARASGHLSARASGREQASTPRDGKSRGSPRGRGVDAGEPAEAAPAALPWWDAHMAYAERNSELPRAAAVETATQGAAAPGRQYTGMI